MEFRKHEKNVLFHFDEDDAFAITIQKTGWKDLYLVIHEDALMEDLSINKMSKDSLLKAFEDITEEDLKKLEQ
jgi:hypothetical protein